MEKYLIETIGGSILNQVSPVIWKKVNNGIKEMIHLSFVNDGLNSCNDGVGIAMEIMS